MMGSWGSGPNDCYGYQRGYENLTKEQRSQLEELDRKFYKETAELTNEILAKSADLNTLLNSSNPDPEKVKALQRELSDLRATLDEKWLSYELEIRKINPEPRSGSGYGRGYGHGMSLRCWR